MISWMQKHNKYLVWTIWVATIAFIGAGFVGWGSYDLGGKAGNVAKVGEVEISQKKLNMVYTSIYNQYNEAMQGQFDEAKAKEMGLVKQAFSRLATQAKILNFAHEIGLIISDEELLKQLQSIPAFQNEGQFSQEIYQNYLKGQRLKAKEFEANYKEELLIQKTIALLTIDSLPLEVTAFSRAVHSSDKLAYVVLSAKDVNLTIDETKVKSFWEMKKEGFMTKQMYSLSIVWTESKDTVITEEETKAYYEKKSFNYSDVNNSQRSYENAKTDVENDLKLSKTYKTAQKSYIAFKKGKLTASEKINLSLGDLKLTPEIWQVLQSKNIGEILKPKIVGNTYATIKIENIILPKIKTYEEAKKEVSQNYTEQAKKEALITLADAKLKNFNQSTALISDFIKLDGNINLKALNSGESQQFIEKLFTSSKEKGIITLVDKIIVYNILEQRIDSIDENTSQVLEKSMNSLKKNTFEKNLIQLLDKQYPTETYVNGL